MKASHSDASEDDDASDYELDYSDFFSVLMYYGHMSKHDILNSSRPFLYSIYKQYAKRACENLGVSPDNSGENEEDNKFTLKESDYPAELLAVSDKDRQDTMEQLKENKDFLRQFPEYDFGVY